jgi:hypothetical protein
MIKRKRNVSNLGFKGRKFYIKGISKVGEK